MSISAALSVADGAGAAVNVSVAQTVTPGGSMTVALQSTTGVTGWTLRCDKSEIPSLKGFIFGGPGNTVSSVTVPLPQEPGAFVLTSEVTDGQNINVVEITVNNVFQQGTQTMVHRAKAVCLANVSNLASYTVASSATLNDSVTMAQGDLLLLTCQSTAAQNGLYQVGAVSSGTAPLTRFAELPTGAAMPLGTEVKVGPAGAVYKNSTWKATATTTGGPVVGTNDPAFYPQNYRQIVTLSSGAYTIGQGGGSEPLFLLSTTGSTVTCIQDTSGGTVTATMAYASRSGSDRTAGIPGTAALVINAIKNDKTTPNTADTSTVDVLVTNF